MSESRFGRIESENVTLPVRSHNFGYTYASFTISAARAGELLPGATLQLRPGRRVIERIWASRMQGLLQRPEGHRKGRWAAWRTAGTAARPLARAAGG